MRTCARLVSLAVLLFSAVVQAGQVSVSVSAGSVGLAQNGALIVAQKGSVVYARKGSNVQHWPGSKLVPATAGSSLPDCASATVTASGSDKELFVASGGQVCTAGDIAVIAQEGSTVIYDDEVPLIRRPVNRR